MARDMLQWGTEWLAGKLKTNVARTVEYRRGNDTVAGGLKVTLGKKLLKVSDDFGNLMLTHADRDYLFTAADLVINSVVVKPVKGDVIADATGGTTNLYEVLAPAGEPEYQTDSREVLTRVHCKHMGTE